ncbi:MAG: helix-turn-helix domain-containing protein [Leptolyngbya sp. BL-A-14]
MTSRKLSESDKQEILQLYRLPGETTSTLAGRYGVSNSTISRILKQSFSEAEYETLIQQKRGRPASETTIPLASEPETSLEEAVEPEVEAAPLPQTDLEEPPVSLPVVTEAAALPTQDSPTLNASPTVTTNGRRLRKRSSAPAETPLPTTPIAPPIVKVKPSERIDPPVPVALEDGVIAPENGSEPYFDAAYDDEASTYDVAVEAAEAIAGEALLPEDADLGEDLDDDDLDDDLDDDDLDDDDLDDDLEDGALFVGGRIAGKALVQVLPLAEASLPRTCYLVVDRSAELIARPLKEFGDLGQIPEAEVLEKTLPIFDNHRVAKRYSNPRTQRVIKLPDAQVLQKTSSHLQAKGITRLLIDGQVYAL